MTHLYDLAGIELEVHYDLDPYAVGDQVGGYDVIVNRVTWDRVDVTSWMSPATIRAMTAAIEHARSVEVL